MCPVTQATMFDAVESERRKAEGMARAASGHAAWLERTRRRALYLALLNGTVTTDDLWLAGVRPPEGASPNIFGSIFNDPRFRFVGYVKSKRPKAHRNLLRVWAYAGPAAEPGPPGQAEATQTHEEAGPIE